MLNGLVDYGYAGLFLISFLAATILPFSSLFVFCALIGMGLNPIACIIIGTIGNTMGGMTNYYLGKLGKQEWIDKYLKVDKLKLEKVKDWMKDKGAGMGILCFLPFVGDLIALVLGFMRSNVFIVTLSMFIGKLVRYGVIAYGQLAVMHAIK